MKLKKLSKESNKQFPFSFGTLYQNNGKGRNKPSTITFDQLRNLEKNNDLISICVNKIVHRVKAQPWHVQPKHEDVKGLDSYIEKVENLLRYPNANPGDGFDDLFSKVVKDLCVIDYGVVEKVRNSKGEVKELYYVDSAGIKPNLNEYGQFDEPAYYQYINISQNGSSIPDQEFEKDDLMVMMINPQGESGKVGYGESPIEKVIMTVLTSLQAMVYNSTYFDDSKLPPYIFNLKGMPVDALQNFRLQFESQLSVSPWKNAYVNVEDLQSQALRPSNNDMQFQQFNEFLMHIIFASFELSPETLGFTAHVNRATAETQSTHSNRDGVGNYLDALEQKFNHNIIGDLALLDPKFNEIEFVWDFDEHEDEKVRAEVSQIYLQNGVLTPNEVRKEMGLDPIIGGDELGNKVDVPVVPVDNSLEAEIKKSIDLLEGNVVSKVTKSQNKWETFYQ